MRLITLQALLAAGSMLASPSVLAAGSVQVSYVQPEKFADIGISPRDREDALQQLTKHFESLASRHLADGQKLNVEVLDVDLAGTVQPSVRAGDSLRIFMGGPGAGQPLHAEKRMLDEWFAAQFGPAAAK
jgi:Protein of unknown function (DUF3016)